MKKLLSVILSLSLLALSSVSAYAVVDDNKIESNYTVLDTITIPDNCINVYNTNPNSSRNSKISVISKSDNTTIFKESIPDTSSHLELYTESNETYQLYFFAGNIGNGYNTPLSFDNTGGIYQKIRIKISDFSSYFNEDGSHTETLTKEPHDYNFTDEHNGYLSYLVFVSGSAVTFAAPDSNGFVEFYASATLGEPVRYTTNYCENYTSAGKISSATLFELTVGDVDISGNLSIADVTKIQKCIAGLDTLNSLSIRNSDINHDGICNIADSTLLQKYLVGSF